MVPPKWMVKISWKNLWTNGWFGGKHPYFWKHPYTLQVVYFETGLFEVAGMSIWVISFVRRNERLINDEGFLFSIKVRKDPKRKEQTNKNTRPWAAKTMKNKGVGHLKTRLFTIKPLKTCGFWGPIWELLDFRGWWHIHKKHFFWDIQLCPFFYLREPQHTPGSYPRHPQIPKWNEFLHKLCLGYVPGVCWKNLRF